MDTAEGDKLNKSDNNKYLLYPDENYDTSFTSFRVKRGATPSEDVFGRDYSHKGVETEKVVVTKDSDNTISVVWKMDERIFVVEGNLPYEEIIQIAKNNPNPPQFILTMLEQSQGNPVFANLLQMAKKNDSRGIYENSFRLPGIGGCCS